MNEPSLEQSESSHMKQPLPNATAVLVLGILSIIFGCCPGFIGLILGAIGLMLAQKDFKLYHANPHLFEESAVKNLNAGRITAIIGLVIGGLVTIYYIFIMGTTDFWENYREMMEKAMEQAKQR